ncbi:MAG: hypothetical protein FWC41_11550 [Firmicutes bacterium]|nr:hypothetical protein [Bacillota bacterium]
MQERKILTLTEVLNLDRRPTLQEMVDLSIEDYTKYLYYKGIIKYIPENLEDYDNWDEYDPECDLVLRLKLPKTNTSLNPNLDKYIDENKLEEYKGVHYLTESGKSFEIEKGFLYVNENKYYYELEINKYAMIDICQIGKDDKTLYWLFSTDVGYLPKN